MKVENFKKLTGLLARLVEMGVTKSQLEVWSNFLAVNIDVVAEGNGIKIWRNTAEGQWKLQY